MVKGHFLVLLLLLSVASHTLAENRGDGIAWEWLGVQKHATTEPPSPAVQPSATAKNMQANLDVLRPRIPNGDDVAVDLTSDGGWAGPMNDTDSTENVLNDPTTEPSTVASKLPTTRKANPTLPTSTVSSATVAPESAAPHSRSEVASNSIERIPSDPVTEPSTIASKLPTTVKADPTLPTLPTSTVSSATAALESDATHSRVEVARILAHGSVLTSCKAECHNGHCDVNGTRSYCSCNQGWTGSKCSECSDDPHHICPIPKGPLHPVNLVFIFGDLGVAFVFCLFLFLPHCSISSYLLFMDDSDSVLPSKPPSFSSSKRWSLWTSDGKHDLRTHVNYSYAFSNNVAMDPLSMDVQSEASEIHDDMPSGALLSAKSSLTLTPSSLTLTPSSDALSMLCNTGPVTLVDDTPPIKANRWQQSGYQPRKSSIPAKLTVTQPYSLTAADSDLMLPNVTHTKRDTESSGGQAEPAASDDMGIVTPFDLNGMTSTIWMLGSESEVPSRCNSPGFKDTYYRGVCIQEHKVGLSFFERKVRNKAKRRSSGSC